MYKASGVILFDDPNRSAKLTSQTYPNGEFLPGTGSQSGSLFTSRGDPLTVRKLFNLKNL